MNTIIPLPSGNKPMEVAGIYGMLAQAFGEELGSFIDTQFKSSGYFEWFSDLKLLRNSHKPNSFLYEDCMDPRFLLSEQLQPNSKLQELIPGWGPIWRNSAKTLREKMNKWSHNRVKYNLENLQQIVQLMGLLSHTSGLVLTDSLNALNSRINAILSGKYTAPTKDESADPGPGIDSGDTGGADPVVSLPARPPIGSKWVGELPTRRVVINHLTRSVTENGIPINNQLGANADQLLGLWLKYKPGGGEAFVAEDGAVMSHILGDPYLIGWFGEDPDDDGSTIRGFFLNREFELLENDIQDVETGQLLSNVAKAEISTLLSQLHQSAQVGDLLSITDYGDISVADESGNYKRIGNTRNETWFPGLIPG